MKTIALIFTVLLAGCNLAIAQSPYATRLPAELQTAQMDSLDDLTWLQGTTPAIRVEPLLRGRPVAVDADTTVRMVIGPSATGTLYAVRTNLATVTNAYEIQWPTIGTNSAGAAWFYTVLFDREGYTYWSGSGKLYIEETTSTASNGLAWIEYTTPNVGWQNILGDNPATNAALKAYIESQLGSSEPLWTAASNRVLYVGDVAAVAYGTGTNEAYRGDWGAAVSNAAVLRSIATVPASAAYSAPASESLPFVVTNTVALTLSGLTDGSIGIRMTTTNTSGVALYAAVVKDGDGETLATINPSCDGSEQFARWPWNDSDTLTVEAFDIPSPAGEAEPAIITAVQAETWEDVSLVGRTNDLADQHLYVNYPSVTNEAANRAYADDAADAALALALGEIATATFNRDLAGFVNRWNPRFDTVAASNSLSTLYGGSTALRLDGEGAAVVPEIRAFVVEAGEVATLTVWSYSGGASNLVPEVTTNLITGAWEQKPESIVSATNIDAFTAQVVFTNDFERLLYVRLVDVSGGSGVPVLRVFGGIAFGDGEAITDWPQGTILGATINEPHTVATNDGILAFTVTADGSGFPLTNDVDAAGFDIQGMDKVVANSLYATNDASVRDLTVRRNVNVLGNAECAGDFVVSGNLTLIGGATNLNWVVIDNRTNVYSGTNYYEESHYLTNYVYQQTIVHTNVITTNNINTYVTQNGTWNATNSEYAWFPHLRDYRDDKAYPVGTWNFSSSTVERITIPPDGLALASVAAFDAGVATIDLGSNWCWRLVADTDCTAINFSVASVPEGVIVPNTVKAILLEVSRGESAAWAWGGHLSHITNDAPAAGAVSHLLLIAPSQDVTATNGWTVF